jgi:hypothetical protein
MADDVTIFYACGYQGRSSCINVASEICPSPGTTVMENERFRSLRCGMPINKLSNIHCRALPAFWTLRKFPATSLTQFTC